ncbi:hypothetical protein ID866_6766 [Astraeus odoratus]|nr:hypothetical protein ID866_6766 [Astraeus odoratus]
MHLLDVNILLDIEDSRYVDPGIDILKRFDDEEVEYAVLSHCWSTVEGEEVEFDEMRYLPSLGVSEELRAKPGYKKIVASCRRAHHDELKWLWIDTCCIDDRERREALNSMYRWYQGSKICYAYLHDVDGEILPGAISVDGDLKRPRWFFRAWTLQELIAPYDVLFFNRTWEVIGNKQDCAFKLQEITRIPEDILEMGLPDPGDTSYPSAAQIISWAADREASKAEDKAYALMGLFDVRIPMEYGVKEVAFYQLQEEILKRHKDHSVLAWFGKQRPGNILADDPSYFRSSADVIRVLEPHTVFGPPWSALEAIEVNQRLASVWLPVTRCLGSSCHFIANLACCREGESPRALTIVLALLGNTCYRAFGDFGVSGETEFRKVNLFCRPTPRTPFTFKFDPIPNIELGDGVLRQGNSFRLSCLEDRVILCGARKGNGFAVIVGYYFGQDWVHIVPSDCTKADDGEKLYHANRIDKLRKRIPERTGLALVKHAHIPETIQAIELVCTRRAGVASVQLRDMACTGCCIPTWKSRKDVTDGRTRACFEAINSLYLKFRVQQHPKVINCDARAVRSPCDLGLQRTIAISIIVEALSTMNVAGATQGQGNNYEEEILAYEKIGVPLIGVISNIQDQLRKDTKEVNGQSDSEQVHLSLEDGPEDVLQKDIDRLGEKFKSTDNESIKQALAEDIVGRV